MAIFRPVFRTGEGLRRWTPWMLARMPLKTMPAKFNSDWAQAPKTMVRSSWSCQRRFSLRSEASVFTVHVWAPPGNSERPWRRAHAGPHHVDMETGRRRGRVLKSVLTWESWRDRLSCRSFSEVSQNCFQSWRLPAPIIVNQFTGLKT